MSNRPPLPRLEDFGGDLSQWAAAFWQRTDTTPEDTAALTDEQVSALRGAQRADLLSILADPDNHDDVADSIAAAHDMAAIVAALPASTWDRLNCPAHRMLTTFLADHAYNDEALELARTHAISHMLDGLTG